VSVSSGSVARKPKSSHTFRRDLLKESASPANTSGRTDEQERLLNLGQNLPDKVFIFSDVCVEDKGKIVIYNQVLNDTGKKYNISGDNDGKATLHVSAMKRPGRGTWNVIFKSSPPPSDHLYIDAVAFFVEPRFPRNMFHFFEDLFFGLFENMWILDRMKSEEKNIVLSNFARGKHADPTTFNWFLAVLLKLESPQLKEK